MLIIRLLHVVIQRTLLLCQLDTFNSFMETFYLLRSPADVAHLTKSIQQFKNGKVQESEKSYLGMLPASTFEIT